MDTQRYSINKAKLREIKRWIVTDSRLSNEPLKLLHMQGKYLCDLPNELFCLHGLEALDLRPEREACLNYYITELPREIGRLTNLRVLFLDTNRLCRIPSEIGKLQFLEKLSLSNNFLTDLPKEFAYLQNLTSLHLSNNKFNKFPAEILRLMKLEFLDMSDNVLSSLPNEINLLTNLHTLMLFHNCLESLPDTIGDMTQLRCLWLGHNKLQRLPRSFGKLQFLDWNDPMRHMNSAAIDENPLSEPPLEVCRQGALAIAEYFGLESSDDDEKNARYVEVGDEKVPAIDLSDIEPERGSRDNTPKQTNGYVNAVRAGLTESRTPTVRFEGDANVELHIRSKSTRPLTPHYDQPPIRLPVSSRNGDVPNGLSNGSADSDEYRHTQRSPEALETARRNFVGVENGDREQNIRNGDPHAPKPKIHTRPPGNHARAPYDAYNGHNNTKPDVQQRNNEKPSGANPTAVRSTKEPAPETKPVTINQRQWNEYKNKQDQHPGMPPPVTRAQHHEIHRSPPKNVAKGGRDSKDNLDALQVSGTPCVSPRNK